MLYRATVEDNVEGRVERRVNRDIKVLYDISAFIRIGVETAYKPIVEAQRAKHSPLVNKPGSDCGGAVERWSMMVYEFHLSCANVHRRELVASEKSNELGICERTILDTQRNKRQPRGRLHFA